MQAYVWWFVARLRPGRGRTVDRHVLSADDRARLRCAGVAALLGAPRRGCSWWSRRRSALGGYDVLRQSRFGRGCAGAARDPVRTSTSARACTSNTGRRSHGARAATAARIGTSSWRRARPMPAGEFVIREIAGNRLIVARAKPRYEKETIHDDSTFGQRCVRRSPSSSSPLRSPSSSRRSRSCRSSTPGSSSGSASTTRRWRPG